MRTYSYGALAPTENPDLVTQELERAHRYYNIQVEIWRRQKASVKSIYEGAKGSPLTEADKMALKAATALAYAEVKEARARRGCAWGTGGCIEKSVEQAVQKTKLYDEIAFRPWDGSGLLAVQLQGGLSTAGLLDDTQVRLLGSKRFRQLHLRVGSDGQKPIWATFPIIWHRDLPSGANIKMVRVTVRRIATKLEYTAQFIIEGEGARRPLPMKEMIAVDLGWRRFSNDGFRVAKWRDSAGDTGELRFPEDLLRRWEKTHDLRSIQDKNFNFALEALREARQSTWPAWLIEQTRHAHQWLAHAKLAGLVTRWREARFFGDEALFTQLEAWRKQDKHLYEWEAHQRGNVLRSRREMYRLFACFLATYKKVVFEKLDLRDFADLPEGAEDPALKGARPRRFKACLSDLRTCAADAVARAGGEWVEVPAEYTTQRCSVCGVIRKFDAATDLVHACPCGAVWDQDDNACSNLLRAVTSSPPAPGRSQGETPTVPGKSTAKSRREKGLATRRARALAKQEGSSQMNSGK